MNLKELCYVFAQKYQPTPCGIPLNNISTNVARDEFRKMVIIWTSFSSDGYANDCTKAKRKGNRTWPITANGKYAVNQSEVVWEACYQSAACDRC